MFVLWVRNFALLSLHILASLRTTYRAWIVVHHSFAWEGKYAGLVLNRRWGCVTFTAGVVVAWSWLAGGGQRLHERMIFLFFNDGDDNPIGFFLDIRQRKKLWQSAQQEGGLRGGSPVPK